MEVLRCREVLDRLTMVEIFDVLVVEVLVELILGRE